MEKQIALVDQGRGLQLSTSRITIHDVVPYFESECSYDEIARWLPSLGCEEIAILDRYYGSLTNRRRRPSSLIGRRLTDLFTPRRQFRLRRR
jgi:hypothetical protein